MPATEGTPTGYLQLACVTWYLYDWFLTLNNEIEFVWSRKWSLTKVLYALIRFTTLALLIAETVVYVFTSGLSQKQCDAFSWGSAIGTAAVIAEVELVLQLRIYIVYNKSKKLLWINAAFYILNIVCAIIVLLEFFSQMRWVEVPPWIIGSCYDTRPKELGAVWVFPMSYELYLAVLAVWKIARNWSEYGRIEGSLLSVLVRDSVAYFFLLALATGVNVVLWIVTPVTPSDSAVNLIHAAGGVGGTRLILSMRRAAWQPPPMTLDTAISTDVEMNAMKTSSHNRIRRHRPQDSGLTTIGEDTTM